ncbi:hypothetical protein N7450_005637 [Penicillium hetheringtonii]|uniref:Uncharacterized protein n=1 Tax=Penicillium hetheringtonii TaxID=911720 RepID=A0AAD6DIW4_9EURO|nr:hypothetical protein N7450_005637 [Penicillium hetheringtonii]
MWANKRNAAMSEVDIREKYTDEQLLDMGDKSPLFKYTLNLNLARKRGPVDMLVKRNAGPEHQKNGMHRLDSA